MHTGRMGARKKGPCAVSREGGINCVGVVVWCTSILSFGGVFWRVLVLFWGEVGFVLGVRDY